MIILEKGEVYTPPSVFLDLMMEVVDPAPIAARYELELHYDCKDGDHGGWLCRVFDRDGKQISAAVGNTAPLALADAMKPFDRLVDHPA